MFNKDKSFPLSVSIILEEPIEGFRLFWFISQRSYIIVEATPAA